MIKPLNNVKHWK